MCRCNLDNWIMALVGLLGSSVPNLKVNMSTHFWRSGRACCEPVMPRGTVQAVLGCGKEEPLLSFSCKMVFASPQRQHRRHVGTKGAAPRMDGIICCRGCATSLSIKL